MSEVKVNKISPRSGTTVTLGDSGDTFTLASGVSLTGVNATFSGDLTVDTNTLYVDSANNRVGVGTTSPQADFHVNVSTHTDQNVYIRGSTARGAVAIDSLNDANSAYTPLAYGASEHKFFDGTNTERMRITSSGNVGIGTSSPTELLTISAKSGLQDDPDALSLGSSYSNTAGSPSRLKVKVYDAGGDNANGLGHSASLMNIVSGLSGHSMAFYTNGGGGSTEACRIDSSGNLLVGTTSFNADNVGIGLRNSDGLIYACRSGGSPALFNRNTSAGDIVILRKDGTDVGRIGTSGSLLHIGLREDGTNPVGLGGSGSDTGTVMPVTTAGAERDNAISLGKSTNRFKNLYLGGSVYLGGTVSANALDDYEEGTFTVGTYGDATGAFSGETGEYTKIGDVVHVRIVFQVSTNFTGTAVDGLPFTAQHSTLQSSLFATNGFLTLSNANGVIHGVLPNGGSRVQFSENNSQTDLHSPNTTNDVYRLSFWYYTS